MTKLQTKLSTALATGALLFNSFTGVALAAEYNFSISGNGSDSESEVDLDVDRDTAVYQSNATEIVNDIHVSSNTGDNKVEDNTGGSVDVQTGDAEVSAQVTNQAGSNVAQVDQCDCDGDIDVDIHGNGTDSDNKVELDLDRDTEIVQENETAILNELYVKANTGENDVEDNTGGDISLSTGDVSVGTDEHPVEIKNFAGSNLAVVGGDSDGGGIDLDISGNGSDSENEIDIDYDAEIGFFQFNATQIYNDLWIKGNSGENDVEDNTLSWGGSLDVETGDVDVDVFVENAAGFNAATSDCGCILDVTGAIEHNGTDSENELELELEDKLETVQDNADAFLTEGSVYGRTGENDAEDNTNGDLDVVTGDSSTEFEVANSGGINVFGDLEFELPWGWVLSL
jgi:hypothetical protein